jgi:catechol 2,3-dioxygenase-like lactoylglutathione lyase family enzyme
VRSGHHLGAGHLLGDAHLASLPAIISVMRLSVVFSARARGLGYVDGRAALRSTAPKGHAFMANERTYPLLPCRDLDPAIAFYEALGFACTYRQARPNPCAVVAREDLQIHLFGMPDFEPRDSYGSVIVVVPDPDALYRAFALGLRAAYRRLPVVGIPRILRPRKKFGTVRGFSVVDPGGNWLRISKLGDSEANDAGGKTKGLTGFVEVAARLGDARGDAAKALATLETGLKRYPDAPPLERAQALLYRAELALRTGDRALARASLEAALALEMSDDERALLSDESRYVAELCLSNDPG